MLPKPQSAGLTQVNISSYLTHSPCPTILGEVTTLQSLDREWQSSYQLLVQVQDGGSPSRSTTGTVHIAVLDLNDHSPTFVQASGAAGGGLPIQVWKHQALAPSEEWQMVVVVVVGSSQRPVSKAKRVHLLKQELEKEGSCLQW